MSDYGFVSHALSVTGEMRPRTNALRNTAIAALAGISAILTPLAANIAANPGAGAAATADGIQDINNRYSGMGSALMQPIHLSRSGPNVGPQTPTTPSARKGPSLGLRL